MMFPGMKLSRDNRIACAGFCILAVLGIYFAFEPKFLAPLNTLGHLATTTATLDDAYTQTEYRGITGYNVTYAYTVDGRQYHGGSALSEKPASTMSVQYLTNNPATSGMELSSHAWIDLTIFAVPVIVLLIAGLALLLDLRTPAIAASSPAHRRR
jgi:hypothetical protein